jgi:Leucine-rich repeat (LRR) protein
MPLPFQFALLASFLTLWCGRLVTAQATTQCPRGAPIVTSLTDAFAAPSKVCILSLNKVRLSTLPDSIRLLTNLQVLLLNKNDLDSLPDAIRSLGALTRIYIGGSPRLGFEHLIDQLAAMPALRGLGLDDNQMGRVPVNIDRLSNLESLGLSGDSLITLPREIGALRHLKILDLYDNHFREPPDALHRMSWIETIFLRSSGLDTAGVSQIRIWLPSTQINLDLPPELYLMAPYRR